MEIDEENTDERIYGAVRRAFSSLVAESETKSEQEIVERLRTEIDKCRREIDSLKDQLIRKEQLIESLVRKLSTYITIISRYHDLLIGGTVPE